ncbi:MAG: exosortase [Pseudoalteromonas tetraodonis]|jgi:exosortase
MSRERIERATVIVAFSFALWPLLTWYLRRMGDGSDEPLGLVALAAACYFGWNARARLEVDKRARFVGLVMLGTYGWLAWLEFPPLLRAIPALGAMVAWFGLWRIPAVVVLLGLSLPVMASLQFYLGFPLRLFAAEVATSLLKVASIDVVREGAQLIYDGTVIGVDPPCSGVRMLWASAFLAAALAGKFRLAWLPTIGLSVVACLLAVLVNALRASLLFFPEAGIVSLPHWTHEVIGAACFAIAVTLLATAARRLTLYPLPTNS